MSTFSNVTNGIAAQMSPQDPDSDGDSHTCPHCGKDPGVSPDVYNKSHTDREQPSRPPTEGEKTAAASMRKAFGGE